MAIDRALLAQTRATARTSNSTWWKPREGENRIRLLSFKHTITAGDIKLGRVTTDYPEGSELETFFVSYRKHWKPTPSTCGLVRRLDGRFIGNCAICDTASSTARIAGESERDAAMKWKPSVKYAVQLIDLSDTSREVKCWDAPSSLIEHIHSSMSTGMFDESEELIGLQGRDLLIRYNPKAAAVMGVYGYFWVDSSKNSNLRGINAPTADLYRDPRYVPPEFRCYVEMNTTPEVKQTPKPVAAPPKTEPVPTMHTHSPESQALDAAEAAAPVKRGRGRPRKEAVALLGPKPPTLLGKWVQFYNVEGDTNSELLAGRVTEGPNAEGMWTVQMEDGNLVEIKSSEVIGE